MHVEAASHTLNIVGTQDQLKQFYFLAVAFRLGLGLGSSHLILKLDYPDVSECTLNVSLYYIIMARPVFLNSAFKCDSFIMLTACFCFSRMFPTCSGSDLETCLTLSNQTMR